jgi:predicted aldo/keto reductase-like oxidoreductase
MFYLGTWELGDLSPKLIKEIIDYAFNIGIYAYDTAAVYGSGNVEKTLGTINQDKLQIVTKIPARVKPSLEENKNILDFYPLDYIDQQINNSLKRLNCSKVHSLLLHNWCYSWESKYCEESIKIFDHIKNLNIAVHVGISLPNQYDGEIHNSPILDKIDFLECPYNDDNFYIEKHIEDLKHNLKEIVLRSFIRGNNSGNIKLLLQERIGYCLNNNLSFTIGSTNQTHIRNNLQIIHNLYNKNL